MRFKSFFLHFVLQANGNILEGINENIIRPVQQVYIMFLDFFQFLVQSLYNILLKTVVKLNFIYS